jgi:hypothetical protein
MPVRLPLLAVIWRGDQKSFDPEDVGANVLAALKNINPAVATYFKNQDENANPDVKSGLKEVGKSLIGPVVGVKSGRYPSLVEQVREKTGDPLGVKGIAEKLPLDKLGDLETQIKSERSRCLIRYCLTKWRCELLKKTGLGLESCRRT